MVNLFPLTVALTFAENLEDPAGVIITVVVALIVLAVGAALYFLPAVIAIFRSHYNWGAIAIVNLFFGWTFVGWVIALAWSVTGQRKDQPG